jgi:hypothetical protein
VSGGPRAWPALGVVAEVDETPKFTRIYLTFRLFFLTMIGVTPDERAALQAIQGYAAAGRVQYTRHAEQRMLQRRAVYADVRHALSTATTCRAQATATWRVSGVDRDGDELVCVVALEAGVVVVTVF